jgi:hypothetical protein
MSRLPGDYGEAPLPTGRSGAVTAVAIVNYIFGALSIVCAVLAVVAGSMIMSLLGQAATEAAKQPGGPDAAQAQQAAGILSSLGTAAGIVIGGCSLVFGILYIFAGVGTMNRRGYGRVLTIILGILNAIAGVLSLISLNIPGIVIDGGYAVFVLIVMFNPKYAAEFRTAPPGGTM